MRHKKKKHTTSTTLPVYLKSRSVLEKLILKYNSPSEAEIKGTIHQSHHESQYESLRDIIDACVKRAVVARGYKYGGYDFEEAKKRWDKLQAVEYKYPWLENDPTKIKKKK